jgi:hypothetical protein
MMTRLRGLSSLIRLLSGGLHGDPHGAGTQAADVEEAQVPFMPLVLLCGAGGDAGTAADS